MNGDSGQIFDLQALLRVQDLDIRTVAKKNESLHAGEYFDFLSKIIAKAPQTKDCLGRIAELKADDNDFKSLEDIKKDFADTGCDKLLSGIEKIIAFGFNNREEAAVNAGQITPDFESFLTKITAAKREKTQEALSGVLNADKTPVEYYENQLLSKALKLLDLEGATRKVKILAVDDAPIILKTISSVLGEEYKVYGMTDPTTLEKFLKQITPELFLLDYKMPSLSGFDLIPVIRSFEEHKDTPIIFLTSEGKADSVSTALKLGACDYIVKPFQGKQLREKIAKHLEKKKH